MMCKELPALKFPYPSAVGIPRRVHLPLQLVATTAKLGTAHGMLGIAISSSDSSRVRTVRGTE